MSAASASAPVLRTMQATDESRPNARATVEQFDREFQQYTTKHGGKSARAVAMARAELSKYRALLWQDDKLTAAKAKQGRLTAAQRAAYEKKVADIEKALDQFHHNVANYNRTKAILSFMLLTAFALLAFFQPWKKYF
ncbi:hypothetical protein Poli38472_006384 [Pythium oligandrum]|uniref:Uncharacterized protein n=1 Tax=Pythium oligandrum TaxID=41045 RepID=A0A8K1C4M6_PYTOL|nr:hypothetical protein Poli38472_006384 [Pythium oligandrum]|eukprot:TMW56374.1 hypothetical protein Poli38472_006384 [Pythium oligandrum]